MTDAGGFKGMRCSGVEHDLNIEKQGRVQECFALLIGFFFALSNCLIYDRLIQHTADILVNEQIQWKSLSLEYGVAALGLN